MSLEVNFLGHKLRSPLILASSGLTDNLESIREAEENGIGAVVLKSLFEEQISANVKSLKETDEFPLSQEYAKNLSNNEIIDKYILKGELIDGIIPINYEVIK